MASLESKGAETRIRIKSRYDIQDLSRGESISVNGVCLTAESFTRDSFEVYASSQTLSTTNLGQLKTSDRVNLERALTLNDRLGGHLVSGHVDCLARVKDIEAQGESRIIILDFPAEFGSLIVDKGSVALDGVSLTISDCGRNYLQVNIIPATWKSTNINNWKTGTRVNMETDIIGKYVQKMMEPWLGNQGAQSGRDGISRDFLRQHGF